MTRIKRKQQLKSRIIYFTITIVLIGISIFTFVKANNTYAIPTTDTSGLHYKYVTEYHLNTIYIGKSTFVDENGNEWKTQDYCAYKKGKKYTLIMHDNGTENIITDDVIVDIY